MQRLTKRGILLAVAPALLIVGVAFGFLLAVRWIGQDLGSWDPVLNWGTVPQWFSGVGTVEALGVSTAVLWRQVSGSQRSQARLIASLSVAANNHIIVAVANKSNQLAYEMELIVAMRSDVRDVLLRERRPYVRPDLPAKEWGREWEVEEPLKQRKPNEALYPDDVVTWLTFRDDAGRGWHRDWQGHLRSGRRVPHDIEPK